jgi:hypothetical protein
MHLNIAYSDTYVDIENLNETGSMVSSNSWTETGLTISASDFTSLSISQITNARSPDGSLPVITLMHPVTGDKLTGLGCFVIPPAPTNLTATVNNGQAGLNWNASTGATGYNIYRSTTNGGPYSVIAWGMTTTNYTDNNFTNNATTYYYVVTAVNPGDESAHSTQVNVVPFAVPVISSLSVNDGNFMISGTNGTTGGSYYILVATNLLSPQWTPLITNQFDSGGNFSFTNPFSATTPQLFYRLQLQ